MGRRSAWAETGMDGNGQGGWRLSRPHVLPAQKGWQEGLTGRWRERAQKRLDVATPKRAADHGAFGISPDLKIGSYGVRPSGQRPYTSVSDLGDVIMFSLVALTLFVLFFFSSMFLSRIGILYEVSGGSKLQKIHPATYLACVTFAFAALRRGNPFTFVLEVVMKFPMSVYFMFICFLLMIYAAKVQGNPFTTIIDTFFLTFLVLVVITEVKPSGRAILAIGIHLFMGANALLGIAEVIGGFRFTPYVLGSDVIVWDWRATAFLGHPLVNSVATGAYALMLIFSSGSSLPRYLRFGMAGLQIAALFFFGGRTSLVLTTGIVSIAGMVQFIRFAFGGTIFKLDFLLAVLALPVAITSAILIYQFGILDQLIDRFANDGGSADARYVLFDMLKNIGVDELLFGIEPAKLRSMQWTEGTEYGIESFWFGFLFDYGLILSGFFFIGLAMFWLNLLQLKGRNGWIIMAYFIVVKSSAASLSVKTLTFAVFVALFLIVFDNPPRLRQSVNASRGKNGVPERLRTT